MEQEIEKELQERFKDIKIEVKYSHIHTYTVYLKINALKINAVELLKRDVLLKTIVFDYDFLNNFMFSSNIEQLYYEIKTVLKKEGVYSE